MSDTNYSYMEVSAKRKKRNQFISALIIVAIVLMGVIVWGWIELQKSRNAERIKNALKSEMEPGFKEPTSGLEPFPESSGVSVQDTPGATSESSASAPAAVRSEAERPAAEAPRTAEHRKEPVKAVDLPREPEPPAAVEAHAPRVARTVRPKPAPTVKAEAKPKPAPARAPEPQPEAIAMNTPPAAEKAPAAPAAKAYPPEDLPLPAKAEASEEIKTAMVSPPAAAPVEAAETPAASSNYKLGMTAYRQQDYVNAIRSFSAVPKPASKKRGVPERDEYVQANFLKGVSLLKVGHLSEAVSAFQNVLVYEKYYPLANMNLGICYVELKQYAKAHQAFQAVIRDQSFIEPAAFDDVMQRTKYFWALAWTRLYKTATDPDKQNFYRQQATLKWKDYEVWFSKNDKYKTENLKAENYLKSLSSL